MRDFCKKNINYIFGFFLIIIGILLKFGNITLLLEGDIYYFLRYIALPYIVWVFILGGIAIILYEDIKRKYFQKAYHYFNRPITIFVIFAVLVTGLSLLLENRDRLLPVFGVMLIAMIGKIYTKAYHYTLPLILFSTLVIDILFIPIDVHIIVTYVVLAIMLLSICHEIYLIIRTIVLKYKKKAIKDDFYLLLNITVTYASIISIVSIFGFRLCDLLANMIIISVISYATFLLYILWSINKFMFFNKKTIEQQ
ncbi:MAG: hypothetical protein JXC31_02760 [Acholeplasmataceae bacterium]|nr:hypothetical protein [Acholeplasmataceae bacterium]